MKPCESRVRHLTVRRCAARLKKVLLSRIDRNLLAVSADALEFDLTVRRGKQRIVAADADVRTRVNFGAALTNQHVAGDDILAVRLLGAEPLGFAVKMCIRDRSSP